MKILFAADGSSCTKRALAFLVNHEELLDENSELRVLHVQPVLPPRVKKVAGHDLVDNYYQMEADKVLKPIRKFLDRHHIAYRTECIVDNAANGILKTAKKDKVHMIVMGTHGHGVLGRILMGSVAQRVVAQADVPVLLVQ
jgi:nucleotide-binding universal stress UspA family protein